MKSVGIGKAGFQADGDVEVLISPNPKKSLEIKLEAKPLIMKLYGRQIERTIRQTLEDCQVTEGTVSIVDHQALDYVIRARILAAWKLAESKKELQEEGYE